MKSIEYHQTSPLTSTFVPLSHSKLFFYFVYKKEVITLHLSYLQVFDSEDHWLRQVHLIALLVNGSCDDRGVDDNGVIRVDGLAAQSHTCILCGQVGTQVPVQDKGHPDLTCKKTHGNMEDTLIVGLNYDDRNRRKM